MVYNLKDNEKKKNLSCVSSPPPLLFPVSVSTLLSIKGEKVPKNKIKKQKEKHYPHAHLPYITSNSFKALNSLFPFRPTKLYCLDQGWTGTKISPWAFWSRPAHYYPRADIVPTRPFDV